MTIHITRERLISDIQKEFNSFYPFLKIELFAGKHAFRKPSPAGGRLAHNLQMKDITNNFQDTSLELSDTMSVYELESFFSDRLNINLQVFRKSGTLWLETTMTDSWTLKQQNDHGMEISLGRSVPLPTPENTTDRND